LYIEYKGNPKIKFNQNFINLEAGVEKVISLESDSTEIDLSSILIYSIYDLQVKAR
jgi:hypothetical protein